jgi:uncharacterized damage-inducible protein DinB
MTPDQGRFLLEYYLPLLEEELKATKKVLSAIPDDQREYRPDPKARTAIDLAWHIATVDVWFFDGIADGAFAMEEPTSPGERTGAEIAAWYDENFRRGLDRMRALSDDELMRPVSFFNVETHPAVFYLTYLANHSIHHRGQLSTYLRPMGATVPSIYGGSADEPFDAAAHGMEAAG